MTSKAKKAFKQLEKLGITVVESGEIYPNRGYFWIDAEESNTMKHLEYYNNYYGSKELNEVLKKHNLYFEWENPGFACVYDA